MAKKNDGNIPKNTKASVPKNSTTGNASQKTTAGGHPGGENKFQEMAPGKGFFVVDSRPGHTQKKNIEHKQDYNKDK